MEGFLFVVPCRAYLIPLYVLRFVWTRKYLSILHFNNSNLPLHSFILSTPNPLRRLAPYYHHSLQKSFFPSSYPPPSSSSYILVLYTTSLPPSPNPTPFLFLSTTPRLYSKSNNQRPPSSPSPPLPPHHSTSSTLRPAISTRPQTPFPQLHIPSTAASDQSRARGYPMVAKQQEAAAGVLPREKGAGRSCLDRV